jgi:hypothetical protein
MSKYKCEFLRVEKKYLLNEAQCRIIKSAVSSRMAEEKYGASTILNTYYDTPDWRLIRASIEKPLYKEKLRLRAYGAVTEDSEVFIEIKKKFKGVVYKRRAAMPLAEARLFLNEGCRESSVPTCSQVLREADWMMRLYGLIPAAVICYDRAAFVGREDPGFRVTIDCNLTGRTDFLDLRFGSTGKAILGAGQYLMEVKTTGGMPLWMCRLLNDLQVCPTSFSKYGEYYKNHILSANSENKIITLVRKELVKSA